MALVQLLEPDRVCVALQQEGKLCVVHRTTNERLLVIPVPFRICCLVLGPPSTFFPPRVLLSLARAGTAQAHKLCGQCKPHILERHVLLCFDCAIAVLLFVMPEGEVVCLRAHAGDSERLTRARARRSHTSKRTRAQEQAARRSRRALWAVIAVAWHATI